MLRVASLFITASALGAVACTEHSGAPSSDTRDLDGDGYSIPTDCDDGDDDVHPGAPVFCDGVDTDCDGVVAPSDAVDAPIWYSDAGGDG